MFAVVDITRRGFLWRSAAVAKIVGGFPIPASAQAVEGGLAMAAAVATVAGTFSELFVAAPRTRKWQNDVKETLARIEFKVDDILRAVKNMSVTIDDALNADQIRSADARYTANMDTLLVLKGFNRPLTEPERKQVYDILLLPEFGLVHQVSSLSHKKDGQGRHLYAGYTVALRGVVAMFYAASMLDDLDKRQLKPAVRSYCDELLASCVDVSSKDSFAARLPIERKYVAEKRAWLAARENRARCLVGAERLNGSGYPDPNGDYRAYYAATFEGSPRDGFSYSITSPSERYLQPCLPADDGRRFAPVGSGRDGAERSAAYLLAALNRVAKDWRAGQERVEGLEATIDAIQKARGSLERFK